VGSSIARQPTKASEGGPYPLDSQCPMVLRVSERDKGRTTAVRHSETAHG
jgi:hypothetical protein